MRINNILIIGSLLAGLSAGCAHVPGDVNEMGMSNATLKKVKELFDSNNIELTDKIYIKVNSGQKMPNNEYLVEGDKVKIKFIYLGDAKDVGLIGVFIDGNNNPLVATLSLGASALTKNPYMLVTGNVDKSCEGHYKALVVINIKNQLLANKIPFRTTIADCGGGNG